MSPFLQARNISKSFPGVQALADVSMDIHAGQVLAVVGENGAGKSTLMKVLAGVHAPDKGQVLIDGKPVSFRTPADAEKAGITLIHQELNLAEDLDVAANIFLGREPTWGGKLGLLSNAMYPAAEAITRRLGQEISGGTRVGDLPPGQQ